MSRNVGKALLFAGVMGVLLASSVIGGCSDGPTRPGDAGVAGAGGTSAGGGGNGGSGGTGGTIGSGGSTATGGTPGTTGGVGGTLGPVRPDASGSGGTAGGGSSGQSDAAGTDSPTGIIPPPPGIIPPGLIDAGTGETPRDRLCTPADMAKPDGACPHKMVVACRPTEPGAPEWCICFPPPLDGKWHCGKEPPPATIAGR